MNNLLLAIGLTTLIFTRCTCRRQLHGQKNYFDKLFLIRYKENIPHYYAGLYANQKAQMEFCENWVCKESYLRENEKYRLTETMNSLKNYFASGEYVNIPTGINNMYYMMWSEQLAIFSQFIANICPKSTDPHIFEMFVNQVDQPLFCEYTVASISVKGISAAALKSVLNHHIYQNGLHDMQLFNDEFGFPNRCSSYLVGCGYNIQSNGTTSTDHLVCTYCGELEECQHNNLSDRCLITKAKLPHLCELKISRPDYWKNLTSPLIENARRPKDCKQ